MQSEALIRTHFFLLPKNAETNGLDPAGPVCMRECHRNLYLEENCLEGVFGFNTLHLVTNTEKVRN